MRRRNVTCPSCGGAGTQVVWERDPNAARGGWIRVVRECDDCLGLGKRPERPDSWGALIVHSLRAAVYSTDELLRILNIPDAEEDDDDGIQAKGPW